MKDYVLHILSQGQNADLDPYKNTFIIPKVKFNF